MISAQAGQARTYNHDLEPGATFTVDKTFGQVSADDYHALLIPGGTVGADKLRGDADAMHLIRDFFPAFCAKVVEEFAEGKHPEQARSV